MWDPRGNTFIFLLAFLIQYGSAILPRIDPLVETKNGLIRGLRASDGDYSMFMGIPYATVNESNPFGPSIPHPGFESTFEAYDDSAICPQLEEFGNTIVGSIDCLHVNVYVPNTANSKNPLPVLVWIYGGRFEIGFSGRYVFGPRFLVKQDVILVTFNYRVGTYGFMCLGTADVPGNQGLKDQQLALRWIKDNINSFGGDVNKITIFGESAGGASVDFHLLYGQDKLFDKVIMQSGVALGPWAVLPPDTSAPLKLANNLGLTTTDINQALEFLAKSDPKLVIASTYELRLSFRPCVEEVVGNVEKFIDDYPVNVKKSNLRNMPILIGYNTNEMMNIYAHKTDQEYTIYNVFYDAINYPFTFDNEDHIELEAQIRHFYVGDDEISAEVKDGLTDFVSDINFVYPSVRTINKYLDDGAINLYTYLFAYDGGRAYVKLRNNITTPGVAHEDEISYFFDVSFMDRNPSTEDQLIIDRVTTMWANFAKFGKPIPEVTDLLPVQWPPATKNKLYYLNIDSELEVKKRNFHSRMAMWNLFYKIAEKYQVGYRDPN